MGYAAQPSAEVLDAIVASRATVTPTGSTGTVSLSSQIYTLLQMTSGSGTCTVTLTVPSMPSRGIVEIKHHATTPRNLIFASSVFINWVGTEPTWTSEAAGSTTYLEWYFSGVELHLSAAKYAELESNTQNIKALTVAVWDNVNQEYWKWQVDDSELTFYLGNTATSLYLANVSLAGSAITSGTIDEPRISSDIARTSYVNSSLTTKANLTSETQVVQSLTYQVYDATNLQWLEVATGTDNEIYSGNIWNFAAGLTALNLASDRWVKVGTVTTGATAGSVYRNADTLRYRDSTNAERLLLNATDNLANLTNTATARTNLGLGSGNTPTFAGVTLGTSGTLVGGTNTVEQYNSTNTQRFNVYGTRTDASNYRRAYLRAVDTSGTFELGAEGLGTGASGNILRIVLSSWVNSNTITFNSVSGGVPIARSTGSNRACWDGPSVSPNSSNGWECDSMGRWASTGTTTYSLVVRPATPAQITADQNNYSIASGAGVVRLATDASRTITGLSASQVSGQQLEIWNVGSFDIVLSHESASSTAANRMTSVTGANLTLSANQIAQLRYDGTTSRWRVWKE